MFIGASGAPNAALFPHYRPLALLVPQHPLPHFQNATDRVIAYCRLPLTS